jgi:pyruvate-formate lyase-activating enzyme
MWVQILVIAGYNDLVENIEAKAKPIAEELRNCVKRVSLLPYHRPGETKFERLELN